MEMDSKPEELDKLERRLIQLKIEREALKKDEDPASKKRKEKLEEDIAELEKEYAGLEDIWKSEKASLQAAQSIRSKLEQARNDMETRTERGDLGRMSEIQYGIIPELEAKLESATTVEAQEKQLLRSRVTDEEIAEVVARATGIPVSKMLEGEREKLLRWRSCTATCHWSAQCGALSQMQCDDLREDCMIQPPMALSVSGPTGVGKTELCKAWQDSCLIQRMP